MPDGSPAGTESQSSSWGHVSGGGGGHGGAAHEAEGGNLWGWLIVIIRLIMGYFRFK